MTDTTTATLVADKPRKATRADLVAAAKLVARAVKRGGTDALAGQPAGALHLVPDGAGTVVDALAGRARIELCWHPLLLATTTVFGATRHGATTLSVSLHPKTGDPTAVAAFLDALPWASVYPFDTLDGHLAVTNPEDVVGRTTADDRIAEMLKKKRVGAAALRQSSLRLGDAAEPDRFERLYVKVVRDRLFVRLASSHHVLWPSAMLEDHAYASLSPVNLHTLPLTGSGTQVPVPTVAALRLMSSLADPDVRAEWDLPTVAIADPHGIVAALTRDGRDAVVASPAAGRPGRVQMFVGEGVSRPRRGSKPSVGDELVADGLGGTAIYDLASLPKMLKRTTGLTHVHRTVAEMAAIEAAKPAGRTGLRAFQDEAVSRYLAASGGMLLGLAPGLGKTVVTAAAFAERVAEIGTVRAEQQDALDTLLAELTEAAEGAGSATSDPTDDAAGTGDADAVESAADAGESDADAVEGPAATDDPADTGSDADTDPADADLAGAELTGAAELPAVRGPWRGLAVVPAAVRSQWAHEMSVWCPDAHVIVCRTGKHVARGVADLAADDRPALLVMSYAMAAKHVDTLREAAWDDLVVDEAAILRNPGSERSRAMWTLRSESTDRALALTGTPVDRSVDDLANIIEWARNSPGLFSTGGCPPLSARYPDLAAGHGAAQLADDVGPTMMRRDRSEIAADLPAVETVPLLVTLTDDELKLADAARRQLRDIHRTLVEKVDAIEAARPSDPRIAGLRAELEEARGSVLGGVTLARMAATDPQAMATSTSKAADLLRSNPELRKLMTKAAKRPGTKRDLIADQVEDMVGGGEAVLIFTDFKRVAEHLCDDLLDRGVRTDTFVGGKGKAAEQAALDFNDGKIDVLVCTAAAYEGLNLQRASRIVHLDLPWTPSQIVQRVARAVRFGADASTPVQVLVPVAKGTIEERVAAVVVRRAMLAIHALDGSRVDDLAETEVAKALRGLDGAVSEEEIDRLGDGASVFDVAAMVLGIDE